MHRNAPGTNPHLWYDPLSMPAVAACHCCPVAADRSAPVKPLYAQRLQQFLASVRQIDAAIDRLRDHYAGTLVAGRPNRSRNTRTAAIGLKMSNQRFQLAVMNDCRTQRQRYRGVRAGSSGSRKARVLIYNTQVINPAVQRLLTIARESRVPVVRVTETEPAGMNYQQWMLGQLRALEQALAGAPP